MQRKNDTTSYGDILSDAWKVSWSHKHLWVFGFFATLVGFGGVAEVFVNAYDNAAAILPLAASKVAPAALVPGFATLKAIISYSSYPALSLLVFLTVAALFSAVFAWMTVTSVGGLLAGIRKISRGGEPTFADGMKAGAEKFWKLLGVQLLSKTVVVLATFFTGANLVALMRRESVASGLFYVGSFVLFTAVALIAALLSVYGSLAVMAKDEPVGKSIRSALLLIRAHWLVSLEMAVVLLFASLFFGFCAVMIGLILSVPLLFLTALASALGAFPALYGVMGLTAILLMVGAIALGSFLTTFQASAWTFLWHDIAERRATPKLHQLFGAGRKK